MIQTVRVGRRAVTARLRSFHSSSRLREDEKLRILFCGSDNFSCESLIALHQYAEEKDSISSIDVVTRIDKRTGRNFKRVTSPAIKKQAIRLGLPLHQIDTFTGWTPPNINLIIAVSFGLLIPPRIIRSSKYGGLNVHPSVLPDLPGAAPLEWAIIHCRNTGISVQTLHESRFDAGIVLDQTAPIEINEHVTSEGLKAMLAPLGAEMLVNAVNNRLYVPPYKSVAALDTDVLLAPRIKPTDKAIDFQTMNSQDIMRRNRAFGKLYAFAETDSGKRLRLVFPKELFFAFLSATAQQGRTRPGVPYSHLPALGNPLTAEEPLLINTVDNQVLELPRLTVEGKLSAPAVQAAARAHLLKEKGAAGGVKRFEFAKPLTAIG